MTTTKALPTRGPWKWFCYPDGRMLLAGVERAVIHCPDAPMTCDVADMDIIAAAPELLSAAKAVLAQFAAGGFQRNTDSDGLSDWAIRAAGPLRDLAALKAAVNKAEGTLTPERTTDADYAVDPIAGAQADRSTRDA